MGSFPHGGEIPRVRGAGAPPPVGIAANPPSRSLASPRIERGAVMLARTVVIWFGLLTLAILNGGFREAMLVPRLGRGMGQAVSTVMLSALILGLGWVTLPWIAPATLQDAWTVGVTWVVLTLAL